jgi:hypothetical protein
MSRLFYGVACVLTGLCLAAVVQADYRILPHSGGEANDGYHPYGSLLLSSATLYGMTAEGGGSNKDVIFALDAPAGNLSQTRLVPGQYPTVQAAIDAAQTGDTIQIAPGTYCESVQIAGKDIVLRSNDPNDPNVTEQTVVEGNGKDPVVKLQNGTERCVLAGLTIRGGGTGIWCSGGSPAIRNCQILQNAGSGVELLSGAKPAIDHCVIATNGGLGVKMVLPQTRGSVPALFNCTIAQNTGGGVSGLVSVRNSILYFNGAEASGPQITSQGQQVTYSCIQGGFAGQGNIDADPWFVRLGRWTDPNDVNHPTAVWISGDYRLQSAGGCWDPCNAAWVRDKRTSPCIDAGNPADAVGAEPVANGGRIDMGAYGGTIQASKSPSLQFVETGQQLNRFVGRGVALGDFNSDGTLDAFVVNEEGFRVYLGDGKGLFADSGQRLSPPSGLWSRLVAGDVNRDGRLEVITGSTIWLNDGQGRFSARSPFFEMSEPGDLAIVSLADLNGDGHLDVFAIRNYAAMRVYFNDGTGRFRDSGQRLGDGTIGSGQLAFIALGDLNGDGCPDLVMGIQDATRSGRVYLNDGTGHFVGGPSLAQ